MTLDRALVGVDPACPSDILDQLALVELSFHGFDGSVQAGHLVLHRDLVADVEAVFSLIQRTRFPVHSVIPIADPRFDWDDERSMAANNSSAFNYRTIAGTTRLSNHATGRAVDINPYQNPWLTAGEVLPAGAKYDPAAPGTLSHDHPVVTAFRERGWTWGGDWKGGEDYHHFEKPEA